MDWMSMLRNCGRGGWLGSLRLWRRRGAVVRWRRVVSVVSGPIGWRRWGEATTRRRRVLVVCQSFVVVDVVAPPSPHDESAAVLPSFHLSSSGYSSKSTVYRETAQLLHSPASSRVRVASSSCAPPTLLMLMSYLVFVFLCSSSSLAIILLLRCLCTAR